MCRGSVGLLKIYMADLILGAPTSEGNAVAL